MKNVICTIIFMYILFTFYFKDILYIHLISYHLLAIIYLYIKRNVIFSLYNKLRDKIVLELFCFTMIGCTIWGLLSFILNQTTDLGFFYTLLKTPRILIFTLCMIIIVREYYPEKSLLVTFMKLCINASCLYVLFTIIMLLIPDFKIFWLGIITGGITDIKDIVTEQILEEGSSVLTRCGLKGFSGADCGLYCSLSIMFILYLVNKYKMNSNIFFIKIIILLLGNFFYSRTSLFLTIISFILFIPCLIIYNKKFFLKLLCLLMVACVAIITIVLSNPDDRAIQWSLGPIYNLGQYIISGGSIDIDFGTSGNKIISFQYYKMFDDNFWNLIIGHGVYTLVSDSGFMSQYYFYGLIGLLLFYGTYLFIILIMIFWHEENSSLWKYLLIVILLTSCIFEYKGSMMMYYYPILIGLYLMSKKEK